MEWHGLQWTRPSRTEHDRSVLDCADTDWIELARTGLTRHGMGWTVLDRIGLYWTVPTGTELDRLVLVWNALA